ncbi:MAG: MaoC family dehydratase N-terminal domain-containing protein [Actinomycetota bacterium]|nr:MaoC family dehydratase N-terminal domain-containing protein [Actinomycetota bacterium]
MALNTALAGKVYPSRTYEVTAEAIRKYARATNEKNPMFLGDDPIAPPAFPIVPAAESLREAMQDEELGVDMAMLVHAEEEHVLYAPIAAGDVLEVKPTLAAVEAKETGHTFTLKVELKTQKGKPVADVLSTMFIRKTGSGARPAKDQKKEPTFILQKPQQIDEDQSSRYAEASGDDNPIHVDPEFARNRARLPGIILQGMCTMAFAARAVLDGVGGGDPTRLKRIRVRFSRPVFPGETITTRVWRLDDEGTRSVFGFDTVNPSGAVVIKDGLAEISF